MKEKLMAAYWRRKLAALDAVERFAKEEKGASDIVAIVVIIVIIVAEAAIFRDQLKTGVQNALDAFVNFTG